MTDFTAIIESSLKSGLLGLTQNANALQGTSMATALLAAAVFCVSQPSSFAAGCKAVSMVAAMHNITVPALAISNPAIPLIGVIIICWIVREWSHARALQKAYHASEKLKQELEAITESSVEELKKLYTVFQKLAEAEATIVTLGKQEQTSASALVGQREKVKLLKNNLAETTQALKQLREAGKAIEPDAKLQEFRYNIDALNGHLQTSISRLKIEQAANQKLKKENGQLAKQNCLMFSRLSHSVAAL